MAHGPLQSLSQKMEMSDLCFQRMFLIPVLHLESPYLTDGSTRHKSCLIHHSSIYTGGHAHPSGGHMALDTSTGGHIPVLKEYVPVRRGRIRGQGLWSLCMRGPS